MVFDSESGISRKTLEDQLTLGKNIDELTGGISNDKIKKMADGPEKTALQAKVDKLKEAHESYKKKVSAACATSNRVYINSIADRNKKSGKLGIGYGADDLKIACTRKSPSAKLGIRPSRPCAWSRSPRPNSVLATTRTSFPAACASA